MQLVDHHQTRVRAMLEVTLSAEAVDRAPTIRPSDLPDVILHHKLATTTMIQRATANKPSSGTEKAASLLIRPRREQYLGITDTSRELVVGIRAESRRFRAFPGDF